MWVWCYITLFMKRDLGTVASIGGTCVSLSRTRSLEVDDELPGPSLCPLPPAPIAPSEVSAEQQAELPVLTAPPTRALSDAWK